MKDLSKMQEPLEQIVKQGQFVLFFTAPWCGDCRFIKPALPEIEAAYPTFQFIQIDRDEFIEICQTYEIFGIPSFIVLKDGQELGRYVNKDKKTKEQVLDFLEKATQD